jgi:hypothetical protein
LLGQAARDVAEEHAQIGSLVAAQTLAQVIAGVAVIRAPLAVEGLVGGVVARGTGLGAHGGGVHEVSREAGQTCGAGYADGTTLRTGLTVVPALLVVPDQGVAASGDRGEHSKVNDRAAGHALSLSVAAITIQGTLLARQS